MNGEFGFYARGRGWIPAGMLEAGEWLLKGDGGWVVIESVGFNGEVLSVFNFEVAEHHTYFVGEESWGFDLWTHNHDPEDIEKAFTKKMISTSKPIAQGPDIDKVDELVSKFGGTVAGWVKKKGWDSRGREGHWYEHHGIGRIGEKLKGEVDPFLNLEYFQCCL